MKQNKWVKLKKILAMLLVATTTMVAPAVTILAKEERAPQTSEWSRGILSEGECYGIFPINWYYEDFQKPITAEKMKILLEGVNKKLGKLNLKLNSSFKPEAVGKGITKEEIITLLYNELGKYEIPASSELGKTTATDYFKKRGILEGIEKELELDKPSTVEQATVLAILLIEDTYNTVQAGAKGWTWKVTKGDNILYISGAIHEGNTGMYPIRQKLKDVFIEADALIVEADPFNKEDLSEYFKLSKYNDGTTLKDHISEDTYNKVLKVFKKLALPEEEWIKIKTWQLANELPAIAASKPASEEATGEALAPGVDSYFISVAHATGKPIYELEGFKHHAEIFDGFSEKLQEQMLNAALNSILAPAFVKKIATGSSGTQLWQKQWYEGDIVGITKSFEAQDSKNEMNSSLFGTRDKEMADKLASFLEKKGKATYFVSIGVGHLVVKDTVIDQLRSKGYTVEIFK